MKKMMAMMAALFVAGAASAASITWDWTFETPAAPSYDYASNGYVLLYLTDPASPFTSEVTLDSTAAASGSWTGDHTVLSGQNVTVRFATDFGSGLVYTEYTANIGVLSGDQATDAGTLLTWIQNVNTAMLSSNGDGLGFDSSVGTWTAVPEPSSMALLALGAAALGLRRKFRK
jgi:hypothetical protein